MMIQWRIRMAWTLVSGMLAFGLIACGDDTPSNGNNSTNNPNNQSDMDGEDGGEEDMGDECEPIVVCPAEACGMVDDGCGGSLECEPCACQGGVPVETTCGPCGLGQVVCDSATGGSCETPSVVEGIEGCEAMLFVDQGASGDGSKGSPFGTISDADRKSVV